MKKFIQAVATGCLLFGATFLALAQRPGGPGRPGGPEGRPPPPDPERFVERALQFDADGDGKLSREELKKFAQDLGRPLGGPGGPPAGPDGPPNGPPRAIPGNRDAGGQQTPATNHVEITVKGEYRYIASNGIPDHKHGQFPNRGNPNRISEQNYSYRVPLHPKPAEQPINAGGMPFGVALNGVPFDPGTAELWHNDFNWRYDALSGKINLGIDESNAHVQPSGAYHYHGLPLGLILKLGKPDQMTLVGYAADGFPMYNQYGHADARDASSPLRKLRSSYRLKKGKRPAGEKGPGGEYDGTFNQDFEYVAQFGDLDECNGRFGVTPENPEGTYYYAITEQFPFVSRLFRGVPDDSFRRRGPPGGGGLGGRGPGPAGAPAGRGPGRP